MVCELANNNEEHEYTSSWSLLYFNPVYSNPHGLCNMRNSEQLYCNANKKWKKSLINRDETKSKKQHSQQLDSPNIQVSTTITTTATNDNNALHLSDMVVMLPWGWQPVSSSPLGQSGTPSHRCPASMQPPGREQENWPARHLRGLVAVRDGWVPACAEWSDYVKNEYFLLGMANSYLSITSV